MTPEPEIPDPAPPYSVDMSGRARDQLRDIIRRAERAGRTKEMVSHLEAAGEALRMRLYRWGDPLRHLRHAKQTLFRAYRPPFIVHYTVLDRFPNVSVWHFEIEPNDPLAAG